MFVIFKVNNEVQRKVPMPRIEVPMSTGYQITVPSSIRQKLNLKPKDKVVFDTDSKKVTVEKALSKEEKIKAVFMELDRLEREHRKRMTPEQKKFDEMSKGWTAQQYHEYFDNLPETKAYIKEKYGV